MRLFTKLAQAEEGGIPSTKSVDIKPPVTHNERLPPQKAGWQVSRAGDGDTAMAIFSTPDEVHEPIDPDEARRLERKIDFMILPYLAVSVYIKVFLAMGRLSCHTGVMHSSTSTRRLSAMRPSLASEKISIWLVPSTIG